MKVSVEVDKFLLDLLEEYDRFSNCEFVLISDDRDDLKNAMKYTLSLARKVESIDRNNYTNIENAACEMLKHLIDSRIEEIDYMLYCCNS